MVNGEHRNVEILTRLDLPEKLETRLHFPLFPGLAGWPQLQLQLFMPATIFHDTDISQQGGLQHTKNL